MPTIFGRGPTATCVDGSLPTAGAAGVDAASRGPFVLLANSSSTLPGLLPLLRCATAGGQHLAASASSQCSAVGAAVQTVLGYGAAAPSSLFARPVRRCGRQGGGVRRWYTTVNVPCLAGDEDEGVLLYAV